MRAHLLTLTVNDQSQHTQATAESTGGADKSLVRPTSQCILFDGENISFDASLVTQAVSEGMCQTSGGCSLC